MNKRALRPPSLEQHGAKSITNALTKCRQVLERQRILRHRTAPREECSSEEHTAKKKKKKRSSEHAAKRYGSGWAARRREAESRRSHAAARTPKPVTSVFTCT
eukprot:201539-Rhodomonas_salina.1